MQKGQANSTTAGRARVSSSPLSVPTTQPAFIEWQSTIGRSILPPKILEQKAKSNHKGDSTRATNKLGLICKKRMHSSRMRTGRALTIGGGGGFGASQKNFFGGKEIEKKKKKNLEEPPQKFGDPQKIGDPPKI